MSTPPRAASPPPAGVDPPFPVAPKQAPTPPPATWPGWAWAGVPLLALIAYAPVLRIGFLLDDFLLLYAARRGGFSLDALLPDPAWFFYRPVGTILTWEVGWQLWGYQPLPYHLIGLGLHAAVALLLGRWLAAISARPGLGWLAGALFAVFPLHLEAVGWLAAQWDGWAALFAVAGLSLFTAWWQRARGAAPWREWRYPAALLCYALALFSKESVLAFLPLFGLAAWAVRPPADGAAWRRLGAALLPFVAGLAFNLGIRFATWGNVGGYPEARTDYGAAFWDHLIAFGRLLLAPINQEVWGPVPAQVVGALSSIGVLAGLVWYGRRQRRVLGLAGAWVLLALLPALPLPPQPADLQQNRFLYLPAAGYCVGLAALLYPALAALRPRRLGPVLAGGLLAVSTAACWVQLQPWQVATAQVQSIAQELHRLLPPQPHPGGVIWYAENPPQLYQGAYLLDLALGHLRFFTDGEYTALEKVASAADAPLAAATGDAFSLRFAYDAAATRFYVDQAAGITGDPTPPAARGQASPARIWNFTTCDPEALAAWQVVGAQASCAPGKGLLLHPDADDPNLILAEPGGAPLSAATRFVRLRVLLRAPPAMPAEAQTQWYWAESGGGWSEAHSRSLPIKADGQPHVYWTFIPVADLGPDVPGLRFDPVNGQVPIEIGWIALDAAP